MSVETNASRVWDREHRSLSIGLLLIVSLTAFEALAVATVLPATATDLAGGDLGWYAWVFSGFMLANLVGIPAAGVLSDRGGPATPFVAGCALFAGGLVFSGLASSMPWLVAGRLAQGLGAGALSSVAYVAVARAYDSRDQPRMLALLATAWVVPGLIGPSIAAAIAGAFGWRAVFLLLVPLTAFGAAMSMRGIAALGIDAPASEPGAKKARIGPALQLAAGCGLALWAPTAGDLATTCLAAVTGLLIAAPALRRLVPEGTLSAAPGAPAALAAKALVTFAFFGAEAFLPLSLTTIRGESLAVAGVVLTTGTMAWTSGAWVQERLVTRVRGVVLAQVGLAMVCAAVAGAAAVLVCPWPAAVAAMSWAIAGLGIGVCYSSTTLAVFDGTPKGGEGEAAAALQLANVLGVALGTGVAGAVVSLTIAGGGNEAAGIAYADGLLVVAGLAGVLAAGRIPGESLSTTAASRLGPSIGPEISR